MIVHRLRVPRVLLVIPALQPLLLRLSQVRQRYFPRPGEEVVRLIADGNRQDALSIAKDAVARSPADLDAWLHLGAAEYALQAQSAAKGDDAQGHGSPAPWQSSQPLIEEDGQLLDLLARPAEGEWPLAEAPERDALVKLRHLAETLAAENAALARRLEPLRQQLGHRVDALETWVKYEHTKYYMRALALYMRRYGVKASLPVAPRAIPAPLEAGFAMNGAAPIQMGYLNAAYPEQYRDIYTDFDIEAFRRVWRGEPASSEDDRQCLMDFVLILGETDKALQRAVSARLSPDASVAVVGSRGPVYEALCLNCGARPTTVRRTAVANSAKDLATTTFAEWEGAPRPFDAAIAACVVEQAGLGMHGEPLDPEADIALMAMLKRMVKPEGLLFLVLPVGRDCTVFNATRIYGAARLERLLDGWAVIDRHQHQDVLLHGRGENRSLFVLANSR